MSRVLRRCLSLLLLFFFPSSLTIVLEVDHSHYAWVGMCVTRMGIRQGPVDTKYILCPTYNQFARLASQLRAG